MQERFDTLKSQIEIKAINEFPLINIEIDDIVFDKTNPNVMSEKQMDALKENMKRWGFLAPVIVNKDNMIIDGEHRVRAYQELGRKNIQAYQIDAKKIDAKIIRQILNKFRGEHDYVKDLSEFKLIKQAGHIKLLAQLLAKPTDDFMRMIQESSIIVNHDADEWVGMPDFIQNEEGVYAKIIVRFSTKKDLTEFGKKIGQKLNQTTKSIRYPAKPWNRNKPKIK